MKTKNLLIASAVALTASASADTLKPTGTLTVSETYVEEGTAPTVSWDIKYPAVIDELVDIDPEGKVDPKVKLRVKVKMVGVGITDQRGTEYDAKVFMKFGSNGFQHLFTGSGPEVDPTQVLVNRVIQPGQTIRYAARVNLSGYNYYYNEDANITVLKNGDTPPSVAGGHDQASVADYLRPYLQDGKISIGEKDLIYVSELTHSNPEDTGYDQQDAITLINFEEVE